jgi:hypothetical protein
MAASRGMPFWVCMLPGNTGASTICRRTQRPTSTGRENIFLLRRYKLGLPTLLPNSWFFQTEHRGKGIF